MIKSPPFAKGSCEKIPLTPALSPAFGGEGKGEGAICKDSLRKGGMGGFPRSMSIRPVMRFH